MHRVAILVLVIFLVSSISAPALASNVSVTVNSEQVHARVALSLVQNVTVLPNVSTSIDSNSGTNISTVFTQALRKVNPSASPSNLDIGVASTNKGLNLTLTLDVLGVSRRNGDILSVNMTWLPFDVNSDLRAQDFSFNTIGSRYMRSEVVYYANASRTVGLPNATITGVTFFVNGTSVGPPAAQNYIGNFTTLNFGLLNPDLSQWNRTYTLTNNTTTWRYFPPELLNFDMRIQRQNVTTDYVATYGYNATISVPGVGRAEGSGILINVGTGQIEWVMAAVVILAFISALTVQALFRARKKRLARFQRK
jgi:hypothetical protein